MDNITSKIGEIVEKVKSDPSVAEEFQKDPAKAIKSLTGIDVPEDTVQSVVTAVKTKVTADSVGDALSGLKGLLGKDN